jgi:hypothetical protein
MTRELSIAQLVGFLVMKPVHLGSSLRLDMGARFFLDLFQDLMTLFLSVIGDVSVDSEVPVVTSSISRFAGPTQFFGGAHRGRVCVCAFTRVSVRSRCERLRL